MQFILSLPTNVDRAGSAMVTAHAIASMSDAAERAGFDGVCSTEHPFPSEGWLATPDGHHALDPFVALSFAAATTSRIRLVTYLCVIPYRNPFLTAKSAMSLHVLSGGRLVLGAGAGYVEDEFAALGVDFAERNELTDEGLIAIRRAWSEDGVAMKGRHFEARGNTMLPRASSVPAILVGGNSRRAIRRAVEHGDGWLPLRNPPQRAPNRRSPALDSIRGLRAMLDYADEQRETLGIDRPFQVVTMPFVESSPGERGYEPKRLIDHIRELEVAGVTGVIIRALGSDVRTVTGRIEQFASEIMLTPAS